MFCKTQTQLVRKPEGSKLARKASAKRDSSAIRKAKGASPLKTKRSLSKKLAKRRSAEDKENLRESDTTLAEDSEFAKPMTKA
jgi:hypothetical protein